jgi:putative endopeptidase
LLHLGLIGVAACGGSQTTATAEPAAPPPMATPAATPAAPPISAPAGAAQVSLRDVGLDPESLDKTVDPCTDFYAYACGNWIKNATIPGDETEWAHWDEIAQRNRDVSRDILENAVKNPGDDPVLQKLGAFYGACMDEAAVEKAGRKPIDGYLKLVKTVKDAKSLDAVNTKLDEDTFGALFNFFSQQDIKDATQNIGTVLQAGLGLPEKEYYSRTDPQSVELRKKYQDHVEVMLGLAGYSKAEAKQGAADVLAIETQMAKASLGATDLRDPEKRYHMMTVAELEKLAPHIAWQAYFKAVGAPKLDKINVGSPEFFVELDKMMTTVKPAAWRAFLAWNVITGSAEMLSKNIVEANFDFYSRTLQGQQEMQPRWRRCIGATNSALGELLGQPWVKRMFSPEAKAKAVAMVTAISDAFAGNVASLDWMDDATRQAALVKRNAMVFQIGYPNKWRTYDFALSPKDYAANTVAASRFERHRNLHKIGNPVDRDEWTITAPTVNAYYQPLFNEMVFPAGILQPPFFSEKASDAANFGAIGLFAGHELTHGFDNHGAKFDPKGNLHDWWSPDVKTKFEAKGECLANQYSQYTVGKNGVHVNGKLTLGENIADGGGIKLSFAAYKKTRSGQKPIIADGYTEDQQFFIGYGQAWCSKMTDQMADMLAQTNEHSPAKYRVNGVLTNLPAFADAFQCKVGTPMHPANTCPVW